MADPPSITIEALYIVGCRLLRLWGLVSLIDISVPALAIHTLLSLIVDVSSNLPTEVSIDPESAKSNIISDPPVQVGCNISDFDPGNTTAFGYLMDRESPVVGLTIDRGRRAPELFTIGTSIPPIAPGIALAYPNHITIIVDIELIPVLRGHSALWP